MWELIRENKRKSIYLLIVMGIILLLLGYMIGYSFESEYATIWGILGALAVWAIMSLLSYYKGGDILLMAANASQVYKIDYPQLYNIVEEMKIAANLPAMPSVHVIFDSAPNAFAVGRDYQNSSIVVTVGLLKLLNRDELQAVIAHEIAHIKNRDTLFLTFAGTLLGSIIVLSSFYIGRCNKGISIFGRFRSISIGSGGMAGLSIPFLIFALISPITAYIFYYSVSKKRELLADATAVRLTRYPIGLASALRKIAFSGDAMGGANKVTAAMFIVNPLRRKVNDNGSLFSTHPPLMQRINILENLSTGVNYEHYINSYSSVTGKRRNIFPMQLSNDVDLIPILNKEKIANEDFSIKSRIREARDLVKLHNNFIYLTCTCGIKIKVPPGYKKESIHCPRCFTNVILPLAGLKVLENALTEAADENKSGFEEAALSKKIHYRKKESWESFQCECGQYIHLTPRYKRDIIICSECKLEMDVVYVEDEVTETKS